MLFSELQEKDVVNVVTAKKLGRVWDLCIEQESGQIKAMIVVPKMNCFRFFAHDCEYHIPWSCVCRISEDIILVEVCEKEVTV